jgi:hypothetical protein
MRFSRLWRAVATRSALRSPAGIVTLAVLVELAAVGSIYLAERSILHWQRFSSFLRDGPITDRYEFTGDGLRMPPMVSAAAARIDDDEEVAGIEVGGSARAYRLRGMSDPSRHIINDVVDGMAVSVTYCDISECVRAFEGGRGGEPLAIGQGGLKGQSMVLAVGGVYYLQDTGEPLELGPGRAPLPYPDHSVTRTTWKAWREAHPETDLYEGRAPGDPP